MADKNDLPDLTPQEFEFVQAILSGSNASDAYRKAYECSTWSPQMIWVEAHRVKHRPNVALWLSRARTEALTSAVMTKEAYLQELLTERAEAKETGNYGAAVKALELAGKVMGHYVDKHEDVTPRTEADTLLDKLEESNPQLAALLRERHDRLN